MPQGCLECCGVLTVLFCKLNIESCPTLITLSLIREQAAFTIRVGSG